MPTNVTGSNMFGAFRWQTDAGMSASLARNWWAFLLRGIIAILFAVIAFVFPGATILSLVWVFAIYAFLDGIFAIVAAVRAIQAHERWGMLTLEGIANILFAIIAIGWPAMTALVFITIIGIWAIISGAFMLGASFSLHMPHGRIWLALGGGVSILYGLLLILAPLIGAVVLTWWLGAYALVFGISLIVLAFRLRGQHAA